MHRFIYLCFKQGVMSVQGNSIDLQNLSDVLEREVVDLRREDNPLIWTQIACVPWWQNLNYSSEEEARKDCTIRNEENIRDHQVLESETKYFAFQFIQGPLSGRTAPLGFQELLQITLKKKVWKGRISEGVPAAYQFFDRKQISEGMLDRFNAPRYSLTRELDWENANIDLESTTFSSMDKYKDRLHQIPEADKLVKALIWASLKNDPIFGGKGITDAKLLAQIRDFKLNLQAAYGIATAVHGTGIIVHAPYYGT
jgi:hypothetical protein